MQKEKSLATIILAAGSSSRLGRPKQMLFWKGETLIHRAVRTAHEAGESRIVVVCGAYHTEVEKAIANLPAEVIVNPNWKQGMGTSLQWGLSFLQNEGYDGFLLMVCDQPFLTSNHLLKLKEGFFDKKSLAAASVYNESVGVPAILSSQVLTETELTQKAQGAKQILKQIPPSLISLIPFPNGEIDIDTEEDWENLQIC